LYFLTQGFIRKLLTLPFLPTCRIRPAFEHLKALDVGPQLKLLIMYIDRQ